MCGSNWASCRSTLAWAFSLIRPPFYSCCFCFVDGTLPSSLLRSSHHPRHLLSSIDINLRAHPAALVRISAAC